MLGFKLNHVSKGATGLLAVLPVIHGEVELSVAGQRTLEVRFPSWMPGDEEAVAPAGYEIQWRVNGSMVWVPAADIEHDHTATLYTALIHSLMEDTFYYVMVVPFVEDRGTRYHGNSTQNGGPFRTLGNGKWNRTLSSSHNIAPHLWRSSTDIFEMIFKWVATTRQKMNIQ